MYIKPFKASMPSYSKIADVQEYINDVRNDFGRFEGLDILYDLKEPAYILYRITSGDYHTDGLICLTDIREMIDGHILRHEKTLEEKELEQLKLYESRRASVKPVLLTYPPHEVFDDYLESLRTDDKLHSSIFLEDKSETHQFWTISDQKNVDYISHYFETEIKRAYIADGHHRLSTFVKLNQKETDLENQHIMSVYVPFNGLRIHPFHRVVEMTDTFDRKSFLKSLKEICFVEKMDEPISPAFKYNFLILYDNKIHSCVWKASFLNRFRDEPLLFDAALINVAIFRNIFKISDVRTDSRISYIEGYKAWEGFSKAVNKNKNNIGFFLYPVAFEDFQKVSDLFLTLPPKSTWFEPRIRNGLVIQKL